MKTVYYVAAYVFNEEKFKMGYEGESYEFTVLVPDNKDHDYVYNEYKKLKVDPQNMPQIEMYEDTEYDTRRIHKKDEWGEDWDL